METQKFLINHMPIFKIMKSKKMISLLKSFICMPIAYSVKIENSSWNQKKEKLMLEQNIMN